MMSIPVYCISKGMKIHSYCFPIFSPLKHPQKGRELTFDIKHTKYSKFRVIETDAAIPTKFCTAFKTTKYSLPDWNPKMCHTNARWYMAVILSNVKRDLHNRLPKISKILHKNARCQNSNCSHDPFYDHSLKISTREHGHLKLTFSNKTPTINSKTCQFTTKCKSERVIVVTQKGNQNNRSIIGLITKVRW